MADEAKGTEKSFEETVAEVKYGDFDTKSPLLGGGTYAAEEDVPFEEPKPEEGNGEGNPADSNPDGTPDTKSFEKTDDKSVEPAAQAAPFKKLNVSGADYVFNSEAELEQMARRGIEYGNVQGRLAPYMDAISAIEQDQRLGYVLADTIRRYRSGVPLEQPQPQNAQPQEDPDNEPEQGDDEDYDDYEKRLKKWRDDRTQKLVEQKVAEQLKGFQTQAQQQRVAAANQQIINYVHSDPDMQSVMNVIAAQNFDPALRQQMEYNGPLFMSVYDTIKVTHGKKPFFGAPLLFGNQPQQINRAGMQTKAPVVESGRTDASSTSRGGVSVDKLPDFKNMSDKDFLDYKNKFLLSRM